MPTINLPEAGQKPWDVDLNTSLMIMNEAIDDLEAAIGGGTVPAGGTTGQVLTKDSGTDGDTSWQTPTGGSIGYVGVNNQTGTTYTIVLADSGKLVTLSNASPVTVTLPQDSSVAIPVGERVDFAGIGVGLVTFAAGSGATVNGTPSLVTRARYSAATAIKIAANTWLLVGDLA